jgi:hypothetical protein
MFLPQLEDVVEFQVRQHARIITFPGVQAQLSRRRAAGASLPGRRPSGVQKGCTLRSTRAVFTWKGQCGSPGAGMGKPRYPRELSFRRERQGLTLPGPGGFDLPTDRLPGRTACRSGPALAPGKEKSG